MRRSGATGRPPMTGAVPRLAACLMLLPAAAAAQNKAAVTAGAVLGAAGGAAIGAVAGAFAGSHGCPSQGNSDACIGPAISGIIWGVGIGTTLGAPSGAHLADHRRGRLVPSLLVSAATFGVEAALLNHYVIDRQIRNRGAVNVIVVATPVIQIVASAAMEYVTRK